MVDAPEKPKREQAPAKAKRGRRHRRRAFVAIMVAALLLPLIIDLYLRQRYTAGAQADAVLDMLIIGFMLCLAIYIGYSLILAFIGAAYGTDALLDATPSHTPFADEDDALLYDDYR